METASSQVQNCVKKFWIKMVPGDVWGVLKFYFYGASAKLNLFARAKVIFFYLTDNNIFGSNDIVSVPFF